VDDNRFRGERVARLERNRTVDPLIKRQDDGTQYNYFNDLI